MFYDFVVRGTDFGEQCCKSREKRCEIFHSKLKEIEKRLEFCGSIRRHIASCCIVKCICNAIVYVDMWVHLDDVDRVKLVRKKLTLYADMSLPLRLKLIVAIKFLDQINLLLIAIFGKHF